MNRILAFALFAAPTALAAQVLNKPKLAMRDWATGFSSPVAVVHCGDDRLFVVERPGVIRIVSDSMTVEPVPFLDIQDSVDDGMNEQGLLGLAFEPDYLTTGYFYVFYNHADPNTNRLSRFRVSDDPDIADPNSEQVLLDVADPDWNHNGGDLHFGPDGYLYISFGDGGSGNDPHGTIGNGQDYTEPLGGMFRIDVSAHDTTYAIPVDNPFATAGGDTLPEIWATGLRNPWRFSFDRVNGDLWIGDVGQNAWEEVDHWPSLANSGPNFGWRCREGLIATPDVSQTDCGTAADYVEPVAVFSHGGQGWCSVIGGYVYRGSWYPHHYGRYIFTDHCAGDFLTFGEGYDVDTMLMTTTGGWSAMGEDLDGQLYVLNHGNGQMRKLYDPCPMDDPTIEEADAVLTALPEGDSYQWYFNGAAITGATAQTYVPTSSGNYQVRVNFGSPCDLISDTLAFISTSSVDELGQDRVRIFPQPAKDLVTLERADASTVWNVLLLDALGRTVRTAVWATGRAQHMLSIADLPAGSYVVRCIGAGEKALSTPLVIAR